MKFALSLIALILLALILPFFIPNAGKQEGVDPNSNLPWQITADGQGGSSVFGLRPDVSMLGDVRRRLGDEIEVAIIAEPNEIGALEGYYAQLPLGFVLAKMIVTVDVPDEAISAMRERAVRAKHMESTTRRITLHPDDLAAADRWPIRAISVIPTVNLDEATRALPEAGAGCCGRQGRQGIAAIRYAATICPAARATAGGAGAKRAALNRARGLHIC